MAGFYSLMFKEIVRLELGLNFYLDTCDSVAVALLLELNTGSL
jgi:hypothetical protein